MITSKETIDVSALSEGFYVVRVMRKKDVFISKLIVRH
jgi:hypothetical protein